MPKCLWDASALIKRYYTEVGSEAVDAIFASVSSTEMVTTYLGYAECAAILRRKFNSRVLDQVAFSSARFLLRQEVLNNPRFSLVAIHDKDFLNGISWIDAHSINSADAAILETYLHQADVSGRDCILVAADTRLLRAAAAEGLRTLNPELLAAADVPALLASL